MLARIIQLISYPIKSCAGIIHNEVDITKLGLEYDRQWMLIDENGLFQSQRKHPKMALIQPQVINKQLVVSAPKMPDLRIDLKRHKKAIEIKVWSDQFSAQPLSDKADKWFSKFLGFRVKLVQYTDISHRLVDQNYSAQDEQVAFADGFPVLVTHEATLEGLNQRLTDAVDMSRFRANVVVQSPLPAWSELHWQKLTNESLNLHLVKPCARCVMTGIEQTSGKNTGTDVLKTLKHEFAHQGKAVFGMNALVNLSNQHSVQLTVGDSLEIIQKPQ